MLTKRSRLIEIPGSEITPQRLVESRRLFMHQLAAGASFAVKAGFGVALSRGRVFSAHKALVVKLLAVNAPAAS